MKAYFKLNDNGNLWDTSKARLVGNLNITLKDSIQRASTS